MRVCVQYVPMGWAPGEYLLGEYAEDGLSPDTPRLGGFGVLCESEAISGSVMSSS